MSVTAEDWDRRIDGLAAKLPAKPRGWLDWLREPHRRWWRALAAGLFILGGIFSILPILGLWMLPVGLALLSQDVPWIKVPLEHCARWIEGLWQKVSRRAS
jgi:hypothetical protein